MNEKDQNHTPTSKERGDTTRRRRKHVAEARATAQRAKLDAQTQARLQQEAQASAATRKPKGKQDQQRLLSNHWANTTIARAIEDYLQDHTGGNHSDKTLEWHRTRLGLL
jgi:regulator of protease activity HflC (stomatin/prohibitin superfamily)